MPVRPRAYLALAVATAVATMFGVQGISAALPALEQDLGISDAQLGLFTAAYMLPAVVFAVPLRYLADALGRRRMFVSMALLYAGAGGAQARVTDFGLLLVLRFRRQPGMPALLTAGFLRFVCKFSLIASLPLMLVDDRTRR